MRIIDVLGKPCPIPVIEAKKALVERDADSVLIKVDNIIAVQNLEKMAKGSGFGFIHKEKTKDSFEVLISKDGNIEISELNTREEASAENGVTVIISRDTMGEGAEELGKILIKGFIYSLTELATPPKFMIFLNSGAYLTSNGANTVGDITTLEKKGTKVLTCGTCINYYGLQGKPAAGSIADMYSIVEIMAGAGSVINI